jgi:hypothetical protein
MVFIDMEEGIRGPHDPWCSEGSDCEPNWDKKNGHPLELMAELLRNWPGDTPTVDLDAEKRHLRFIQIVAGYPEIVSQMYPLDWPTHPDSIRAFQLSLFLDSLPVNHSNVSPIHSVRSAILFLDHKLYSYGGEVKVSKGKIKDCQKQCLTILFQSIRKYYLPEIEFPDNAIGPLGKYEAIFLNNFHSMDNNRFEEWWPTKWETGPKAITRGRNDPFESKHYHTFKFRKIQTWINNWADPPFAKQHTTEESKYPLSAKVRHNILSGTSVLLECFFAQLRRHILAKYRPGSITIDGGGRITFYAKKDNVEQEIKDLLENSFVARPPTHPYHYIITQTLEQFGKGKICQDCTKEKEMLEECPHGTQFPQWEWQWRKDKEGYTPKRQAYQRFLYNNELSERFFPPSSFEPFSEEELPLMPPLNSNCPLCNETNGPCKIKESPKDIENICLLHWLTFNIGKSHKRRDFSIRKVGSYDPDVIEIHSSAAIDINALGYHFSRPIHDQKDMMRSLFYNSFDERSITGEKIKEFEKILIEPKSNIFALNHPLDLPNTEDEAHIKRYSSDIRGHYSIYKSRKSFQFNAKWWLSLSSTLDSETQNHEEPLSLGEIGAWIAAGDDLLLVRRGKKNKPNNRLEDIIKLLDNRLKEQFPNSNPDISFCAGLENRGEIKIFEMIQRSKKNEKTCKNRWKTRAEEADRSELYTSVNPSTGEKKEKPFDRIPNGHSSVSSIVSLGEGPESSMFLKSNSEEEE